MPGGSTFIKRSDFTPNGEGNRLCMPPPISHGSSVFDGVVVFSNVEAGLVQAMLPHGVTLAAKKDPEQQFHPIVHIAGVQHDTKWALNGGPEVPGDEYNEFILLIPFVVHDGGSLWHSYAVHMYLDHEFAVEIGRFFAYRKTVGFVHLQRDVVSVRVETDGHQTFSGQHDDIDEGFSGDLAQANAGMANFQDMRAILGMPVLGVDPDTGDRLCSYFDLDFSKATIAAIDATFSYTTFFDPNNLAPGKRTNVADGAMRIQDVNWHLDFPPLECGVGLRVAPRTRSRASSCASCNGKLPKNAQFCPHCGAAVGTVSPPQNSQAVTGGQDGERRQASVAFVDLGGSTTFASTMDPEALRQLLRDFRAPIERVVALYCGLIAQYFGDGILIFFGYPTAREDAAEQAVSAALDIAQAVRDNDASGRVRVRVGVATGIVVAGEQGDKAFSLGEVAVGGPLWLAARLQTAAPEDGVVIANETFNVAGHLFDCQPMGAQTLKGYAEQVPAWLVRGHKRAASRFAARRAVRGPSPIVGRDTEVRTLLDSWSEVKQSGKGTVVAVIGDAGIGKSRLVEALYERLAGESVTSMQYHCAPHFRNTAMYPVIAQIERAAGLERDDVPAAKLAKLEAMLAQSSNGDSLPRSVAYIASLLSIPCGPPYPALPEAPDRRKEGLLATLQIHLATLAGERPLLLLVEDWHWSDPSTQELLKHVVDVMAERPVMVVLTSRTDIAAEWMSAKPVIIRLHRLADEDCGSLIAHVAGGRSLPARFVEQVLRKAEGVPLYVEEITKSLIDAGALNAEADAGASPSLAVPSTLRDLMQSRLDSLARAKEVAQLGAAVGREFGYPLLRALQASESDLLRTLHQSSESDLRAALEALVNAEVVQTRGAYPDAHFLFRHALIQDAAYETMLLGARPGVHREIAKALLASEPDIADTRPEVVAHHFLEAGNALEASEYFHKAGTRAASRAANVEAGEHFRAAVRALAALPETSERHERELVTQVELGLTVTALRGYAAQDVIDVYGRARHLCTLLGNNAALFPVLRGLCTYYMMRAEFTTALELATECARIGDVTKRPDHRIEALAAIGYTLVYLGKLTEGRRRLEEAVAAFRAAPEEYATSLTVRHGIMATYALLAIIAWMQGEHDYSDECSRASMLIANLTERPFDFAYAYCFAAMLANFQGDTATAASHAERGISYSTEHAFKDWLMAGKAQRAIAGILRGEASKSRATLEATAKEWQASGAELNRHVFMAGHAAALLATFNAPAALARVDEAIAHGERFHEHWLDAEMHRLRGMILEFTPNGSAAAADAYRRAVQVAIEQQAPYLALRSAVKLWACDNHAGRASDAAQLVKGILASLPPQAHKASEFAAAQKLLAA